MKLRALLILATMVLGGMLLSGVVLAVTKHCNNNCKGTNSRDSLTGSNSKNKIHALGGGDSVKGLRGADGLYGEGGNDGMKGGPGVDYIDGGIGKDRLNGKTSGDYLVDIKSGGFSSTARQKQRTVNVLIGDRGNDTIRARNGKRDIIRGGPGRDKAYVDKVDKVTGVEKEVVPGSGGGPGGPQPKKQCADGKDNDGDGKTDRQDPGCASAADNTESPDPPPKQCADGKDNDNDGKIDFGTGASNDPGCESATDNTENTPPDAKNDDLPTTENNSESIDVLSNDTDDDGDTLTVTNVTDPRHGTVTRSTPSDKTPSYRPDDCYDGRDSFDYIVSDGHGGTDKGTVNVTVDPDPEVCPPPGPGPAVPAANWTSDHP